VKETAAAADRPSSCVIEDPVVGARLSRRFIPDFGELPRAFWVLVVGTLINRTGGFVPSSSRSI